MMHCGLAPIAVFAYTRTRHLSLMLDALEACPEFPASPTFVFSDGPKNEAAEPKVAAVRRILRERRRPNMTIIESPINNGIANSIIAGVTKLCVEFGRAIVFEDDLVVSPCALAWLNAGLNRYADVETVWQISAHQFPVPEYVDRREGVFLHLSTSWGWATWKRSWDRFDPKAPGWEMLKTNRAVRQRFDLDRSYPYAELLERQMTGTIDSWDICWWWSMFKEGGLNLFPPRSLVSNIGMDETATHSSFGKIKRLLMPSPAVGDELVCPTVPAELTFNAANDAAVYKSIRRMLWVTWLRARLRGAL